MIQLMYHNIRDPKTGRFTSSGNRKQKRTRKKSKTTKVDIIGLLIDGSGSMRGLADDARKVYIDCLLDMKGKASKEQPAFITTASFSNNTKFFQKNQYFEGVDLIPASWYEGGMTALEDAVCNMIEVMKSYQPKKDQQVSYLLLIVTDGLDNYSVKYKGQMKKAMDELTATDIWTIGVLAPPGSKRMMLSLGFLPGNIKEWEPSILGINTTVRSSLSVGTQSYYAARQSGATRTQNLFLDLSKINPQDLKNAATTSKSDFHSWKVDREQSISEFVISKIGTFKLGRAYYELTKPELVQFYKLVILKDKSSGKMYCGLEARNLIGLVGDVKVSPHNLSKYQVFVQSTSNNRMLVRGTTLLYFKG